MPNGYQRIRNDIRYFRKVHFCPDCGSQLNKAEVSRVVNAGSPEARDFDFTMSPGIAMVGDVQFTWDEFECPECHRHFSVNEIKKSEGIHVRTPRSKTAKLIGSVIVLLLILLYGFLKSQWIV